MISPIVWIIGAGIILVLSFIKPELVVKKAIEGEEQRAKALKTVRLLCLLVFFMSGVRLL